MRGLARVCVAAVVVLGLPPSHCWNTDEMEVFDVVEDVNQNFYEFLGVTQDAPLSEIKKAYRKLSLQLHPDKNDAPDAEVKFRQLVSIYDVVRDEGRRAMYDRVLVEGLPDWRSPIYYYRRARKMSLLEIAIILTVVISVTQYLMAWGTYIDRRQCVEEALIKKYKIKDRKKKKAEDLENIQLMEEELGQIPKPSWWNILPVQLVRFAVFLVTGGPGMVQGALAKLKEERQRKLEEEKAKEEEERKRQEEEEKRKEKKASRKEKKRPNKLPDFSNGECLLEAVEGPDEEQTTRRRVRPATSSIPVITGGPWTDEDFSELARLMAKFPGGTVDRWERIADLMGRTVYEVTKMSSKAKSQLAQRHTEEEAQNIPQVKVKVKTRGEKGDLSAGSDEMWSTVQQRALENALKQNPKGTDQRWDRIARAVPDKTKEECMQRFKFLAEMIRKKKEESEKKESDNTSQEDGEGEGAASEDGEEEEGGGECVKEERDSEREEGECHTTEQAT